MKGKVAILYICTGNYSVFWEGFYKSSELNFLPEYAKHYFVFTDDEQIITDETICVFKIFQKKLGWPFDTLFRFKMFDTIKNKLKHYDYIFFFNANIRFLKTIGSHILPNETERLLCVLHPGFYNKQRDTFTYETDIKSTAYIPSNKGEHYYMGGFNGGIAHDYLTMISILNENIDIDLKNEKIAIWHDESHLNAYLIDKSKKILTPSYGYPEDWKLPFEPIVIILDKNKWGGHDKLRNSNKKSLSTFLDLLIRTIKNK